MYKVLRSETHDVPEVSGIHTCTALETHSTQLNENEIAGRTDTEQSLPAASASESRGTLFKQAAPGSGVCAVPFSPMYSSHPRHPRENVPLIVRGARARTPVHSFHLGQSSGCSQP